MLFASRRSQKEHATPPAPLFSCTLFKCVTLSTTRRRLIGGIVFMLALLAFVIGFTKEFFIPDLACGGLLYGLSIAACVILGGLTALRWGMTTHRAAAIFSIALMVLLPIVAMTMVECLNGVFTWDWYPQNLLLNFVLYYLFYGLVYVCSGSFRLSMLIVNPLFFLLGLTHHWVMAFRGTPFVPMDFFSAGTAANVAASYDFSPDYQIVIAVLLLIFLQIAGYKLRTPSMDIVLKVATRVFFATLIVVVTCLYFFTDQYAKAGLKPDFWNQARGYRRTGVVMNFCLNTKYLYVTEPDGYDPDQIADIVYGTLDEESDDSPTAAPNVICIMNESLADLRVLGDVQTNIPFMPFLDSLTENTIRGNLYVPVIGSGTSNTEFEFLTGVSTSFFPAGSNAYMLYMKEPQFSLVSTLSEQGYTNRAFHPYYASGWNRIAVYNHFGFSKFYSLSSVIPNDILLQYSQSGMNTEVLQQLVDEIYPDENVLLRRYVSDSHNYRKIMQMYENRDEDKPFFLFNVTMQNHGGYTEKASNFTHKVYITDPAVSAAGGTVPNTYPKANQFLSLMKYSDDAIQELLAYFEQQEEPTVICIFGDHQPSVETNYILELLGAKSLYSLTPEQEQSRYITPFYIWANYDIPEQTIDRLSVNYLSSLVMQTAGVEMPAFNRYLLKLSETLPVISTVGTVDAEGIFYPTGTNTPHDALLADYEKIAYNYIHDQKHRVDSLYSLSH
ncbi:MAG: LTA synthase family protein [Clostridia bacterium]|nr:LTA synthase family protein [Clostridia bacterium]